MGHYGGRGTTAAAMVHLVITIYEDACYLCVCVVRKTTSTWPILSVDSIYER